MSVLDGVRRVLLAHAHPDDETLATGALIVHLGEHGIAADVVTATRGEMGEVVAGPLSHLAGTTGLVTRRERELAGALSALGVARHAYLGTPPALAPGRPARVYLDSGMRWVTPTLAGPALTASADSLTAAGLDDVAADLAAVVEEWAPDLLVSYDAGGGYGHPDHVRVHDASVLAARGTGVRLAQVTTHPGDGVDWFNLPHTLPTVQAALRCHATQLRVDGAEVIHSGGQREPIVTALGLQRVETVEPGPLSS